MLINDPTIIQWYQVNSAYSDHAASWNNDVLAKALCGVDDILKAINKKVDVSHDTLPISLQNNIAYIT